MVTEGMCFPNSKINYLQQKKLNFVPTHSAVLQKLHVFGLGLTKNQQINGSRWVQQH